MRCCDIHLKLDPNGQAVEEAIARHLSRVHGYIGSIDEEISLVALLQKLPSRPKSKEALITEKRPPLRIWRLARSAIPPTGLR